MIEVALSPTASCTIRPARDEDAAPLVDIIQRAFEEYRGKLEPPSGAHNETSASILALLQGGEGALIAEHHATGEALGCVFFRPHPQHGDVMYLHRLAVVPEVRGQGIASTLVDAVERATLAAGRDYVWLGVRIALPGNRAFYLERSYYPIAYAAHTGFAQPTYVTMQKRVAPPIPSQVLLEPWSPAWAAHYAQAAEQLRAILGEAVCEIHHIGSTAIPRMPAKPTIDLLVVTPDLDAVQRSEPRLILNGWQPRGENGIPGRLYYRKGSDAHHTHHLHVYADGHEHVRRQLAFVAYLSAHAEDAKRYADLKRRLASAHAFDPAAYTDAKTALVDEILARALAWCPD